MITRYTIDSIPIGLNPLESMQGGQPAACSVQILIRQILYYYFLRTTSRSRLRTALRRRNPLSPNVVLHFPSARMRRRSLLVSPILRRSSALFPHTGKCSHPFAHPIWRWAQKCLQRADLALPISTTRAEWLLLGDYELPHGDAVACQCY